MYIYIYIYIYMYKFICMRAPCDRQVVLGGSQVGPGWALGGPWVGDLPWAPNGARVEANRVWRKRTQSESGARNQSWNHSDTYICFE